MNGVFILLNYIKIGDIKIDRTAALAPMASVGDKAYRYICKKYGACYVVSEMASAKGIFYGDKKSAEFLEVSEYELPMAVQLFGEDPVCMAFAAKKAVEYGAKIIDVNMGCPVPKVAGNGCGSHLMRTPKLASEIIKAMTDAVNVPITVKIRKGWDDDNINAVEFAKLMQDSGASALTIHGRTRNQMYKPPVEITVKIRKGWDDDNINAVEFAKLMQDSGASALTIHGRTRNQMYKPPVDIDIIKQVKDSLKIPVIGNGDIVDIESAINMYEKTGCDLIMIGRGSYGKPWIFNQIAEYFKTGKILPEPSLEERLDIMEEHISLICKFKGELIGMREARKQVAFYLKGIKNAANYRHLSGSLSSYKEFTELKIKVLCSAS